MAQVTLRTDPNLLFLGRSVAVLIRHEHQWENTGELVAGGWAGPGDVACLGFEDCRDVESGGLRERECFGGHGM